MEYIRPNKKKMNCFSCTAASVLKAQHYFFYCFLKIKIKTKKKPVYNDNIVISNDHAVSLGPCGPLQVMLGSLFILDSVNYRGPNSVSFMHR